MNMERKKRMDKEKSKEGKCYFCNNQGEVADVELRYKHGHSLFDCKICKECSERAYNNYKK